MSVLSRALALVAFAAATVASAATPQQEKAFTDAYKKAYEANDAKGLSALLYTKGADPQALDLYKMMMSDGAGGKISSITLEPLSDADKERAAAARPGPGGKSMKLPLVPTRKLVIKTETKSASGTSTNTRSVFVAEQDGKVVIPVPVAAK
jgi:hypothetical protein